MRSLRRKKGQVPVSFFAFQDIITALAGSMLLIVLLIAYGKSRTASDGSAPARGSRALYHELQQKIAMQEKSLELKKAALEHQHALSRNQKNHATLKQQQLELERSNRELDIFYHRQQSEQQKWQQKLSTLQHDLQVDSPVKQKLLQLAGEIEKLRQDNLHKQYLLKIIPADNKKYLLLECGSGGWFWSDGVQKIRLGSSDPSPATAMNEIKTFLRRYAPETVRLIIAVRPSAGGYAQALKDQLRADFPTMEIISEPLVRDHSGGISL